MAASRTSFEKLQRDRAKKARAAEKRARRHGREREEESSTEVLDPSELTPGQEIPADQLLKLVAELHEKFENEEITFEEFEDRKTELFALISVD